jgi:AraC-like DNA-binding protein
MDLNTQIERINTIATANTNVLSVELYNHRLGRLLAWPNTPSYDKNELRDLLHKGSTLRRLQLVPHQTLGSNPLVPQQKLVLSLFMYDSPADSPPGLDGVLIMNIDSTWLFESFDLLGHEPDSGSLYVLGADGHVLYARGNPRLPDGVTASITQDVSTEAGIQQSLSRVGGESVVLTSVSPRGAHFLLLEARSLTAAYASYRGILYSVLLASMIFLIFPMGVALLVSGRLYHPMKILLSTIYYRSGKDPAANYMDEFSYLGGVFRANLAQLESLREREESNAAILRRFLLRNLLSNSEDMEYQLLRRTTEEDFRVDFAQPLLISVVEVHSKAGAAVRDSSLSRNVRGEIIRHLGIRLETVETQPDQITFLANADSGSSAFRARLIGHLNEAIVSCKMLLGVDLAISVSETISDLSQISRQFQLCRNNIHYSYIFGLNIVIQGPDIERHETAAPQLESISNGTELRTAIIHGESKKFRESLRLSMRRIAGQTIENAMASANELVNLFISALKARHELLENSEINPSLRDLRAKLFSAPTLQQLEAMMVEYLEREMNTEGAGNLSRRLILVDAVKEYIAKNIADSTLYLPRIAGLFKVNPTYLGRIFRSETSVGFVDYLQLKRMERAKELLLNNDLTVAELMERTGFENKSNFYRVFKKLCGMTPKDFVLSYSKKRTLDGVPGKAKTPGGTS